MHVCNNCAYSYDDYDIAEDTLTHYLQCRRFPPQIMIYPNDKCRNSTYTDYPNVTLDQFCGEFKQRQEDSYEE